MMGGVMGGNDFNVANGGTLESGHALGGVVGWMDTKFYFNSHIHADDNESGYFKLTGADINTSHLYFEM